MPVLTGRKDDFWPDTTNTPSFSWALALVVLTTVFPSGPPEPGLGAASGSMGLPLSSTSRTTTAWMGAARAFVRVAVVMSAVALSPGRRLGGGSLRVIVTLKSLAWLPVLLPAVWVWVAVVDPRTMAEEPISVISPLIFTPSRA